MMGMEKHTSYRQMLLQWCVMLLVVELLVTCLVLVLCVVHKIMYSSTRTSTTHYTIVPRDDSLDSSLLKELGNFSKKR
jgi:hypothetical protein